MVLDRHFNKTANPYSGIEDTQEIAEDFDVRPDEGQRCKRRFVKYVLGAAAVAAVVGGGAMATSGVAARYVLQSVLRSNGFPRAHVEDAVFTPNGLYADHISLDGNDFSTVDQLNISFGWFELLTKGVVDTVNVKSIELTGEADENGQFKLAGWDATLPLSSGGSALLPVHTLHLQGVTLDLDTEEGNFRIDGKLHLETKPDNSQSIGFSLWSKQKQLSFSLDGRGTLQASGAYDMALDLPEGRLEFDGFQASRLSGHIDYTKAAGQPSVLTGKFSAGSIKTLNALLQNVDMMLDTSSPEPFFFKTSPAGYPEISVAGRWNRNPPEQFELTIESKKAEDLYDIMTDQPDNSIKEWIGNMSPVTVQAALPVTIFDEDVKQAAWAVLLGADKTRVSGTASLEPESGNLVLDVFPAQIKAMRLAALLPLKEKYALDIVDGTVDVSGRMQIVRGNEVTDVAGPLSVAIQDMAGEWNGFLFGGLDGKVDFSRMSPLELKGPAGFVVSVLNDQGEVASGQWQLSGGGASGIQVSGLSFDLAGGRVTASPFAASGDIKTVLKLDHIDMAKLSALAKSESIVAQGTLSGELPLHIKKGTLTFLTGKLGSDGTGFFKYAPQKFPSALQGNDPRMETVRQALSDFRFSVLSFEMDGPMDGNMTTRLRTSGTSPLFGTRAIQLNLNLEGALGPVLQQFLQAGDLGATLRSYKGAKK